MTPKDNKNPRLSYIEFGKILYSFPRQATDFQRQGLLASSTTIAPYFQKLYFDKKFAVHSFDYSYPFSTTSPEEAAKTTFFLIKEEKGSNYFFGQVERRTEIDIISKRGISPSVLQSNRSFNQIRFTSLPNDLIQTAIYSGKKFFSNLPILINGTPKLCDRIDVQSGTPPLIEDFFFQYIDREKPNDEVLLGKIVNLLYNTLYLHKVNNSILALIMPNLSFETKLNLIDNAQALLYPVLGVITFSLDYVLPTTENIEFYFCPTPPPETIKSFPNLRIINDLSSESVINENENYFEAVKKLNNDELFSPTFHDCLECRMSLSDAVNLTRLLHSPTTDFAELQNLFIRSFSILPDDLLIKIFILGLQNPNWVSNLLEKAEKNGLLKKVIAWIFNKKLYPLTDLAKYVSDFEIARNNVDTYQTYYTILRNLLRVSKNEQIYSLSDEDFANLVYDLVSQKDVVNLQVAGRSVTDTLFSYRHAGLFSAINKLNHEKKWNTELTTRLVSGILMNPKNWILNEDIYEVQTEISKATGLDLPNLYIERLKVFLYQAHQSGPTPDINIANTLLTLLDQRSGLDDPLVASIRKELSRPYFDNLLSLCSNACLPVCRDNKVFAKYWLKQISLDNELFSSFYSQLVTKTRSLKLNPSDDDAEQWIDNLLFCPPENHDLSIQDGCKNLELENQYEQIIKVWIGQSIIIPLSDVNTLIQRLPESNVLLAKNLRNINSLENKNTREIAVTSGECYEPPDACSKNNRLLELSTNFAKDWLNKTSDVELRKAYFLNQSDLLAATLCQINNLDNELIKTILTTDIFTTYRNITWRDYSNKVKRYCSYKNVPAIAKEFANLLPQLDCRENYQFFANGLWRLVELKQDPLDQPLDEELLRLFLFISLSESSHSELRKLGASVILRNLSYIDISTLKDDEVFSIHYLLESNIADNDGNDSHIPEFLKLLLDEGNKRYNLHHNRIDDPTVTNNLQKSVQIQVNDIPSTMYTEPDSLETQPPTTSDDKEENPIEYQGDDVKKKFH